MLEGENESGDRRGSERSEREEGGRSGRRERWEGGKVGRGEEEEKEEKGEEEEEEEEGEEGGINIKEILSCHIQSISSATTIAITWTLQLTCY